MSRLLGLVRETSQIDTAFSVFDAIRRPRAQRIVQTSQEAGDLCAFKAPGIGSNMDKIVENQAQRYLWIWLHDLDEDVKKAETEFRILANGLAPTSAATGRLPKNNHHRPAPAHALVV